MAGIEGGSTKNYNDFVGKYNGFKKDGLSNGELHKLKEDIVYKKVSTNEVNKFIDKEILKDGRVDDNEAKLLVTIGFSLDETSAKEVKKHISSPTNEYITTLFDKGQEAGKKAVNTYSTNHDIKAGMRNMASFITGGTVDSAEVAVKINNQGAIRDLNKTLANIKDSAQKNNCVNTVLKEVTGKNYNVGAVSVTENFLNKTTGKEWNAISLSKYNDENAKELLKGQENKAIVVKGNHTYVFTGFDGDGNLKLKDPSSSDKKTEIKASRDSSGMTIFVQGKGDGKITGNTNEIYKNARKYDDFITKNTNNKINYSDKIDKTGESFEVRKLLLIMGDPDSKIVANGIFKLVGEKDLTKLKSTLASKGIKLNEQELRAFISVMNTPMKTNHGNSMLDEMKWLNDSKSGWTESKTKYNVGIAYSDINLADYFTKTDPKDIYKNFQDLLAGKEGC